MTEQIVMDSSLLEELMQLLESLKSNYLALRHKWEENEREEGSSKSQKLQVQENLFRELNNTAYLIEDILVYIRQNQAIKGSKGSTELPIQGADSSSIESNESTKEVLPKPKRKILNKKPKVTKLNCSSGCLHTACNNRHLNAPFLREMKSFNNLVKAYQQF